MDESILYWFTNPNSKIHLLRLADGRLALAYNHDESTRRIYMWRFRATMGKLAFAAVMKGK